MTMTTNVKEPVVNPIIYFTNVGKEIEEILSSNDISIENFLKAMDWEGRDIKNINKLTKLEAKQIENTIGIAGISSYLYDFQKEYKESAKKADSTYKENLKIYRKLKHITPLMRNEFIEGIDILDDIADFLDIEDESEIIDRVHKNIALYRISTFEPDSLNLYAWLRRGEIDFYKEELPEYNKSAFLEWINSYEWRQQLYNINYIKDYLPKLFQEFGISLVYTPHLNKTVFGAVRWLNEKNPLVQVSDKGKCIATFWYTLFHEFGHVIEHENDEIFEGTLDLPKSKINRKEQEANSFAYKYLFNGDGLRKYIFSHRGNYVDENFITETSRKFKVDKIFTAFWMKKAQIRCKTIYQNMIPLEFE